MRRRARYGRVAFVAVVVVLMLSPSLRAPAPLEGSTLQQRAVAADDPSAGTDAAVRAPQGPLVALGVLRIPKLGLETAYYEGVHPRVLEQGPGHWPGTALPGEAGNAVLSGHRSTYTAPFRGLTELASGDDVLVVVGGEEVRYRVFETLIVDAEAYSSVVLAQPSGEGDRVLTLFACHPEGSVAQRIVVRSRAV